MLVFLRSVLNETPHVSCGQEGPFHESVRSTIVPCIHVRELFLLLGELRAFG